MSDSYMEFNLAVGDDIFTITPDRFDVDPLRKDPGLIYSHLHFRTGTTQGNDYVILSPLDFGRLRTCLWRYYQSQAAPLNIADYKSTLHSEADWAPKHQLVLFQIKLTQLEAGPNLPEDENRMHATLFLQIWMKPKSLQKPLVATEAILCKVKELRSAFGKESDDEEWYLHCWQN